MRANHPEQRLEEDHEASDVRHHILNVDARGSARARFSPGSPNQPAPANPDGIVQPMSSLSARTGPHPGPWSDPRLRAPSAEEWEAMSPAERTREEERILGVLDGYREAMAEGTPHSRPKINAYKDLSDHFSRAGRSVFLATELCVLYPAEPAIVPALLAVMDVADPERERNTWRVLDEGRGIDLVLEFRNLGKKHKDLVENVKDYAQLGIKEYFSLDCRSKRLRGWHLANVGASAYTQLVPQGGVFPSRVLDLELGVAEGRLRFFKNLAQIPTSEELVGRLQKMTDVYQDQLEVAVERLESARTGVIELLLRRLSERGLALTEEQRTQVLTCEDFARLLRWLERASSAPTSEEVLST
jgi:Uma2 family endonuclease